MKNMKFFLRQGLHGLAFGFILLTAERSHSAVVRVMNSGSRVFPSVIESGYQYNISGLQPLETYSGVLWYDDPSDAFDIPQANGLVFYDEANFPPQLQESVDVVVSNNLPTNVSSGFSESPLLQMFIEKSRQGTPCRCLDNKPNNWEQLESKVSAGTRVDSYFIFLDGLPPEYVSESDPNLWRNSRRINAFATLQFEENILGVIGNDRQLLETRNLLGRPSVTYDNRPNRQLDANDSIFIRGNGECESCIIDLSFLAFDGMDPLRVITESSYSEEVPEPLTVVGTGLAVGFAYLFKKMKRR
ncbi:PEP-CTERM sorting domain-containing protein [bacterium]|nr:PEP-CTERM sorting domain-containing protein [bacterium]